MKNRWPIVVLIIGIIAAIAGIWYIAPSILVACISGAAGCYTPQDSSVGIIGGADGPTAILVTASPSVGIIAMILGIAAFVIGVAAVIIGIVALRNSKK